jgi:hypothetical protein
MLDHIRLETNMGPCSIRRSKTAALRARGDTGFASYCNLDLLPGAGRRGSDPGLHSIEQVRLPPNESREHGPFVRDAGRSAVKLGAENSDRGAENRDSVIYLTLRKLRGVNMNR